jgi:hypothetical protein
LLVAILGQPAGKQVALDAGGGVGGALRQIASEVERRIVAVGVG